METLLLIRKQLRITYRFFSAKKISVLRVYDWVIFDLPSLSVNDDWVLFDELDLRMLVSVADANCHIRLSSLASSANTRYVLNQFDPSDLIQQDLSLLWRHQYADKLLPFISP